jgi:uncharacterized protein with PhoU and TrkA domain
MSYIIHNDRDINERIHDLEKTVLDLIIKVDKLSKKSEPEPEPEKEKPVNLVELYGLKPLSFYKEE